MLPDCLVNLDSDFLTLFCGFDGLVLNLHGSDLLGEIRTVSQEMYIVPYHELARKLDDGDVDLVKIMCDFTYSHSSHMVFLLNLTTHKLLYRNPKGKTDLKLVTKDAIIVNNLHREFTNSDRIINCIEKEIVAVADISFSILQCELFG